MKQSIPIIFISLFVSAGLVSAQETLPLKDALTKASQSNLSLLAARKELMVFEGKVRQASAVPNPDVEVGMAQIPFNGSGETTKEAGVDQTIEIWGKRSLRKKTAQADMEFAQAQYGIMELDILRKVKEAYWDVSLSEDRVNFAQENLKFQQRFLARVQDRFQSGQTKLADVARAKLEVASASNDLLVARKNMKSNQATLNRFMGEDIRKNVLHTDHLKENVLHYDEDKLVEQALKNRPERHAFDASMNGATAEFHLAKRLLSAPDLKSGFIYQKGEREDGRDSWGGKVGLTFPLWYRYGGEREAAAAKIESLKTRGEDIAQGISLDVHQAILEIDLSAEQIQLWKQAVDQATEAARLAEERYMEGDDLLIFIQARRELVVATLEYLEALRNYEVNLAALEASAGTNFSGGNGQ